MCIFAQHNGRLAAGIFFSPGFFNNFVRAHPEMANLVEIRRVKNLTAGIGLLFQRLIFLRNTDIGQIGHLWMGTGSENR